MKYH